LIKEQANITPSASARTGKELILATKVYAKEDRQKSWMYLLSTLLLLIGAGILTIAGHYLAVRLLASLLTGLLIVRMFVIYHDFQHHAILHRSPFAAAIMYTFGILILAPPSIWKRSHDYHHNHNSKLFSASIGSYPIATAKKFMSMSPKERRLYLAIRHPVTILLGYFSMFMFGMCLSSFISSPSRHYDSLLALLIHFSIIALVIVFFGWQVWLISMLIPFMLSTAIGAYLFYAQHNFPGVRFAGNEDWKYEGAALDSSSYMKMNPFLKWCTANISYHHIHHLNSRIPFYRLPEAMEGIPELQQPRTTSFTLSGIISCFRLKVWDQENGRMIGMSELKRKYGR
jgi:omega-6 fatty acid desaturase (delta-12 desaturase)